MTRATARSRDIKAGCFVCHGDAAIWTSANAQALAARHHDRTGHQTWCRIDMTVTYGVDAGDERQIDIEDAIASASSGARDDDGRYDSTVDEVEPFDDWHLLIAVAKSEGTEIGATFATREAWEAALAAAETKGATP